jgi:hypothetical protein
MPVALVGFNSVLGSPVATATSSLGRPVVVGEADRDLEGVQAEPVATPAARRGLLAAAEAADVEGPAPGPRRVREELAQRDTAAVAAGVGAVDVLAGQVGQREARIRRQHGKVDLVPQCPS